MRRTNFCIRGVINIGSVCIVACTTPQTQQRLAGGAHVPNPVLVRTPINNNNSQDVGVYPLPRQPSGDPSFSPTPLVTPPPLFLVVTPTPLEVGSSSVQPRIIIEGPEVAALKADEKQTVHAVLLDQAHLISVEGSLKTVATHSLSIPIAPTLRDAMNVYRARDDVYGSFDGNGKASINTSANKATFEVKGSGDYLISGDEIYIPPTDALIPIPDAAQEKVETEKDGAPIAISSLRTTRTRRIASAIPNLHVKNYLGRDPFVLEPVILFLHGMGEREPLLLWRNCMNYLRNTVGNKELFKGVPFFVPTYNSSNAVHVSKEWIKSKIFELFGSVPLILACHSMGCLVARDLAADPEISDLVVGGVLLAGANLGSPWVPKKRMRSSLTNQPDATALLTAQTAALAKVMPHILEYSQRAKSLSSLVQSLDEGLTSKGALSLATARGDIPRVPFQTRLTIWPYTVPFREVLSEEDAYVLPCDPGFFPQTPTKTVIRYGRCYANFAHELRVWERQRGLIPRWYAYAGYYRGAELRSARESFLQRLASTELLKRYLSDSTRELDEEGLKFAASLLADRITRGGVRKRFSDGLVDPEDVWMLEDGPYIESATSRRDNLQLDEGVIRQRLPRDVINYRSFLRSHSQIVRGLSENDSELFGAIAQDMGSLMQQHTSQGSDYQESDLDGIRDEIKKTYYNYQLVYDVYDRIVAAKITSVAFRQTTQCSTRVGCADLFYDVILTTDNKKTGTTTTTILKSESRRAYRVWRAWRLYDG